MKTALVKVERRRFAPCLRWARDLLLVGIIGLSASSAQETNQLPTGKSLALPPLGVQQKPATCR